MKKITIPLAPVLEQGNEQSDQACQKPHEPLVASNQRKKILSKTEFQQHNLFSCQLIWLINAHHTVDLLIESTSVLSWPQLILATRVHIFPSEWDTFFMHYDALSLWRLEGEKKKKTHRCFCSCKRYNASSWLPLVDTELPRWMEACSRNNCYHIQRHIQIDECLALLALLQTQTQRVCLCAVHLYGMGHTISPFWVDKNLFWFGIV